MQARINGLIYLQQVGRVEFSNFIGLFSAKDKLPQPKIFTGACFCNTEGP